jgi:hypothetical protein
MLEIYKYVTTDFATFAMSTVFTSVVIATSGWAFNAVLIGFRGIKCDKADQ